MEKKVTTVNEYLEKSCSTKLVELPSGAVFKIRKVTARDYVVNSEMPIRSTKEISTSSDEKNQIAIDKLTPAQRKIMMKANDQLIVKSVISPKLSIEKIENCLCVDELSDTDYYKLVSEITSLSFVDDKELKFFRPESNANSS